MRTLRIICSFFVVSLLESHAFQAHKGLSAITSFTNEGIVTILYSTDPTSKKEVSIPSESEVEDSASESAAATGTINDRLMAEVKAASDKEKYGARSAAGRKLGLSAFKSEKTQEEREAAIAAARDLNGVNPVVAILGSFAALGFAAALWWATTYLGEFFAMHPVIETDAYFLQRLQSVFRNVVMGLASLASGFFGVTGFGIFLLGVRVAYGVSTGELDPTPIKKAKKDEIEMPNVMDLMMNKKPSRRRGSNDNNPFGI